MRYNHNVRPRLQMITALRLEWAASPRTTSEPLLVRFVTVALPVCELVEDLSLTKHSVTFKNDPYLVLLQFAKKGIESKCVKFKGYTTRLTH